MMFNDSVWLPVQLTVVPFSEDTSVSVVRVEVILPLLVGDTAAWNMNPWGPAGSKVPLLLLTPIDNSAVTATVGYVYKPELDWQLSAVVSSGFRSPNIDDVGKIREKSGKQSDTAVII